METRPAAVFVDGTGRRARRVRFVFILIAIITVFLAGAFVLSLITRPSLPLVLSDGRQRLASYMHRRGPAEKALLADIAEDHRAAQSTALMPGNRIAGGYFAPWEDDALDSFKAHANDLTHVYPTWLELDVGGRSIRMDDWEADRARSRTAFVETARANGVRIVPVLGNASEGHFDAGRVVRMLADTANASAIADQLVAFIVANDYAGLQVDFENVAADLDPLLSPWLSQLHKKLAARGKEFSIAVEAQASDVRVKSFAESADYLMLMAYDEHSEEGPAGPIASAGFVRAQLRRFTQLVSPSKLVLGVGAYGYDWRDGGVHAQSLTASDAIALAAGYRDDEKPEDVIDFDAKALEPTFEYADDDGHRHEVWFLDATSVANTMTIAGGYPLRGAALWALGEEDPASWRAFGRHAVEKPDLRSIIFKDQVGFAGTGELLRVIASPQPGARRYERHSDSGLITDETYLTYPTGWLVRRSGAPDRTIALTFDDGPDPVWTPRILEILKRHHVRATFFMVGEAIAKYPQLVRQIYADGHEIGNHSFTHPNMAHADADRVRLELTATERAIEAIIGRSAILFRPPYNADSEPSSYGEIMPIAVASNLGFVVAGESIDPLDWNLHRTNGTIHRLTSGEIVQSVLEHADEGHAVLLHDSGGDRSATVEALEPLILALQARGYRLATVGELSGIDRTRTMPPLSQRDSYFARVNAVAFGAGSITHSFLLWGFMTAILLGLARIILMISLRCGGTHPHVKLASGTYMRVDVLIAAYNEAPVIARTIESVLASRDIDVRIILIDDGSSDGTSAIVAAAYSTDSRVMLLCKANGGKASALNVGLAHAEADIIVGLDADTLLAPDALIWLASRFEDPRVGAVAGNVKVGNAHGLVTRWQSIEYITSQNVDRNALSRMNAITVVPGAIGAWRRSALLAVGGYNSDTMAEDMDLTWRIRRAGWVIINEPRALAFTEAPHTLGGLMKQRFRWTFGTLQCLWKQRGALFRYGWFGAFALPSLWVFQIVAQLMAPLIDLQLLIAIFARLSSWWASMQHDDIALDTDPVLLLIAAVYLAFLGLELLAGWLAYRADGADMRELWLLPTQRLVYRQIMYIVVWRAIGRALTGLSQAWGKLHRTGQAKMTLPS